MSEWYNCPKCGTERENLCACLNTKCEDYVALAIRSTPADKLHDFATDMLLACVTVSETMGTNMNFTKAAGMLAGYVTAEVERELSQIRETLYKGVDRDLDDITTPHLAVVAVNAIAQLREENARLLAEMRRTY